MWQGSHTPAKYVIGRRMVVESSGDIWHQVSQRGGECGSRWLHQGLDVDQREVLAVRNNTRLSGGLGHNFTPVPRCQYRVDSCVNSV